MWARTTLLRCKSSRMLRRRSFLSICELGQATSPRRPNYWRGYRRSSCELPWRPWGNSLSCLGQTSDRDRHQNYGTRNVNDDCKQRALRRNGLISPLSHHRHHPDSLPIPLQQKPILASQVHSGSSFLAMSPHSHHHSTILSPVQRQRARFALACCILALDHSRNHGRANTAIRLFSSSNDPPKKEDAPDNQQRTDPDFAEYLTGSTNETEAAKVGSTDDDASLDAITTTQPPAEAQINLEGTEVPLDDHTETYKYIRRRQQTGWENAREKTGENVRRALAGNVAICAAKLAAFISSGSSSMFSEFIHSVVDCGNQSLLLLGLRDAGNRADRKHPYGYGKSIYFYALVSALGTFFLGAGVSGTQAWGEIMEPSLSEITWQVWSVLVFSFTVDGYVLARTVRDIREGMPKDYKKSLLAYVRTIRDPATLAVLLEDGAACVGILIATAGISAASSTGMPVFDGIAGLAISGLLASMGLVLVRINQRFLLGQAVDSEITNGIERILLNQRSIDAVYSVQSQWTGPDSFAFKAEVDFDGTYLAAMLMPKYEQEFLKVGDKLDQELRVLLSWYAEDVMRSVEREVRKVEAEIRNNYPGAEFIELEPMSKDADQFAIDDGVRAQLRRVEVEALNRYLRSLYQKGGSAKTAGGKETKPGDNKPPTK